VIKILEEVYHMRVLSKCLDFMIMLYDISYVYEPRYKICRNNCIHQNHKRESTIADQRIRIEHKHMS